VNDPRRSASKRIVSALHTPALRQKTDSCAAANGIVAALEVYDFSSLGCSFGLGQLLCTHPGRLVGRGSGMSPFLGSSNAHYLIMPHRLRRLSKIAHSETAVANRRFGSQADVTIT
jgi:hypothetical protein